MKKRKTVWMTETALISALLCVISPISIPMPASPVPFSMSLIGIYLAAGLLASVLRVYKK